MTNGPGWTSPSGRCSAGRAATETGPGGVWDGDESAQVLEFCGGRWLPFDERTGGLGTAGQGWPARPQWHFPWAVLTATKEAR